jgi:hypothetical protein
MCSMSRDAIGLFCLAEDPPQPEGIQSAKRLVLVSFLPWITLVLPLVDIFSIITLNTKFELNNIAKFYELNTKSAFSLKLSSTVGLSFELLLPNCFVKRSLNSRNHYRGSTRQLCTTECLSWISGAARREGVSISLFGWVLMRNVFFTCMCTLTFCTTILKRRLKIFLKTDFHNIFVPSRLKNLFSWAGWRLENIG